MTGNTQRMASFGRKQHHSCTQICFLGDTVDAGYIHLAVSIHANSLGVHVSRYVCESPSSSPI